MFDVRAGPGVTGQLRNALGSARVCSASMGSVAGEMTCPEESWTRGGAVDVVPSYKADADVCAGLDVAGDARCDVGHIREIGAIGLCLDGEDPVVLQRPPPARVMASVMVSPSRRATGSGSSMDQIWWRNRLNQNSRPRRSR